MIRDWCVGFYTPGGWRWWHTLTRPGFGHVVAMGYDVAHGKWVLADWCRDQMAVSVLDHDAADEIILEVSRAQGVWLNVQTDRFPPRKVIPARFPITCVGFVKHLLGIRGVILTPYQLYCELRRRECRPIFAEICGDTDHAQRHTPEQRSQGSSRERCCPARCQ